MTTTADSEAPDDGARNSSLVVGHNKDRAFVVRGNKIGVFKTGDDIQYSTTMTGLKTSKGKYFNPNNVSYRYRMRQLGHESHIS